MKNKMTTSNMTMLSLLTAIALIIYIIEAQIPPLTPVPGIKMGLSNIVSLFALYTLGPGPALFVLLARILLGTMFAGQMMSLVYSLCGGLLAFGFCILLYRFFPPKRLWVLSAFSAIFHNVGQIIAAIQITQTFQLIYYLPLLIISGIVTGIFTGFAAQSFMIRMKKIGLVSFYRHNSDQ